MSQFSSFPFLRTLFPFVAGIITAIYVHKDTYAWLIAALVSAMLFIAETFLLKLSSRWKFRYFSGLLCVLSFFFLGTFLVHLNSQHYSENHFSRLEKPSAYYAEVAEAPIEKKSGHKLVAIIKQVKTDGRWKTTRGKIVCYIEKNTSWFPQQGDCFLFSAFVQPVPEAKNPGQFDYKQYLYYHNIYHQVFIKSHQVKFIKREGNTLKNFAFDLRKKLIRSFKNCGLKDEELAVASALLFGVTDQLDPSLIRAYAGTGALHVLSVSGLHVAILYGFLLFVLSFMNSWKNGRIISGIIILFFIWFYALLTGLTPSVLRSSTMFTFIVAGQILSRQSSAFNSIAASAFVLLCYDPFLIMEVGFQLSYLAVTGIIVLYPIINRQLNVKSKWVKPVWDITSVSIAAQLATLPLGLLYFHQFPNYFVFSNLLVIPLSGLILYTGIIASLFYLIPIIQFLLVYLLEWLIYILNKTVGFIEQLPYALMEGISITILETCLLYAILITWLIWYSTSNSRYLKWMTGFATIICLLQINEAIEIHAQKKIIVYHAGKHTCVDLIKGRQHVFVSDSALYHDPDQLLFHVKHNWDDLNLAKPEVWFTGKIKNKTSALARSKKNVIFFGNKSIQIIDDHYNYKTVPLFGTDYILLTKNAKINLAKIKTAVNNMTFIADGSNKFYKIERWAEQAKQEKLKFYTTAENGAFVVDL